MSKLSEMLKETPCLLMEVELKPMQGSRFQATGFPDLGAARYQLHDGTEMLLVESAQSIANCLEAACWDRAREDLIEELRGLPYVRIKLGYLGVTTTLQEFHRLNSPYIWESDPEKSDPQSIKFRKDFRTEVGISGNSGKKGTHRKPKKDNDGEEEEVTEAPGILDTRRLAKAVFKYDPNSVIHGVFLEKIAGRLRLTRALSGFIEARNVRSAESGGVKFDHVLPKPSQLDLSANEGFGNVPFHRTEFTAERITAYFNLDLSLLRGYGLGEDATELLIALSFLKIHRFLKDGLRLRASCYLEPTDIANGLKAKRPENFVIPPLECLNDIIKKKIAKCSEEKLFAEPAVTEIEWKRKEKRNKIEEKNNPAEKTAKEETEGITEGDE